jgi:AcrR family transcriptional regulator
VSQPSPAPGLRRRDEARALFRDGILDAAEGVFAERGFQGARMQDIAERARIAVGTVYNHFDEKEDILHALLEERTAGLIAEMSGRDDDPPEFEARLEAQLRRVMRFIESHRAFYVVALECGLVGAPSAGGRYALIGKKVRRVERMREAFRSIIDDGVAAGVLDDEMDPARLLTFFGASIRAFTIDRILQELPISEDEASTIVHFFLHGAGHAAGHRANKKPASRRGRTS